MKLILTATLALLTTAAFAAPSPYQRMDFGPALFWTYQIAPGNIAQKGLAIRLDDGPGGVSKGRAWMVYDHDTMRAATAGTSNGVALMLRTGVLKLTAGPGRKGISVVCWSSQSRTTITPSRLMVTNWRSYSALILCHAPSGAGRT